MKDIMENVLENKKSTHSDRIQSIENASNENETQAFDFFLKRSN